MSVKRDVQVIELVCDTADLTADWGAEAPDVLIVAGFAVASPDGSAMMKRIRQRKLSMIGNAQVPVKWNLKDTQRALELHGLESLKPTLLKNSEALRSAILEELRDAKATVFVSAILAYSNKKQVLGKKREDLIGFGFGNLLMRAGMQKASLGAKDSVQIILDWPEKGNRGPFVAEYLSAWRNGRSVGSGPKYICGPLSSLNFSSGPVFGVTDIDERLQVADLIAGASRTFVSFCLGSAGASDFGVVEFQKLAARLWRQNGRAMGKGITVSPTNSEFSTRVLHGLNKLGC